jgi:hypothetical protein
VSHPFYHAQSAARRWGGEWNDYIAIEQWFDQTKSHLADCRHRLILHNDFGIDLCLKIFGPVLTRASDGGAVAVEVIASQHIQEDFADRVPTLAECLGELSAPEGRPSGSAADVLCRRFGGVADDYAAMEAWFGRPEQFSPNAGARAVILNSFGIYLCEQTFGPVVERSSDGKVLPTRLLAEHYVNYYHKGRIPALAEMVQQIPMRGWMCSGARPLSRLLNPDF